MYHNIINLECNRAVREGVKISEVQKTATKLISEINMYVLHEPGTEKYRAGLREIHRQIKARLALLKANQEITGGTSALQTSHCPKIEHLTLDEILDLYKFRGQGPGLGVQVLFLFNSLAN